MQPRLGNIPIVAADPSTNHLSPSWRVARLKLVSPHGWRDIVPSKLLEIRAKLANFESMTWNDILVTAKKRNHSVSVSRISNEAQNHLSSLNLFDVDEVISLHLTGTERIWGFRQGAVLQVLWWDPEHHVCPSLLKNT